MKIRSLILSLFIVIISLPQVTHASWWNPFSWKKVQNVEVLEMVATTTEEVSDDQVFIQPSVEDLLKRIAELEDKLEKALNKKETSTSESVAKKIDTPVSASGLSDSQITAKIKPAIVLVETATSSGSGVIIDSQGHVLVEAHTVWTEDENKKVVGVADVVSITLSSGVKKTAKVLGIDEALDVAVLEMIDKSSFSYVKVNFDSNTKVGDKAYIFGVPSTKGGSSGGSSFVSGVISQKTSNTVEMTSSTKPLDNGGAIINAGGEFIGIPNKSVCKVLEEMKNCITYKVGGKTIRTALPKLLLGMKLYRDKKYSTDKELLIRGQFEGIYGVTKEGVWINSAVNNITGSNNFDYFNSKLSDDENGKMTKIYLNKLKVAAERIYKALDFLEQQSYNLNILFINEDVAIKGMGSYQQKIIRKIEADNLLKLKEYKAKAELWSKKKNEYDGLVANPAGVTHDYLMEQGVVVESVADYLTSEQKKIIETFSGENVDIF